MVKDFLTVLDLVVDLGFKLFHLGFTGFSLLGQLVNFAFDGRVFDIRILSNTRLIFHLNLNLFQFLFELVHPSFFAFSCNEMLILILSQLTLQRFSNISLNTLFWTFYSRLLLGEAIWDRCRRWRPSSCKFRGTFGSCFRFLKHLVKSNFNLINYLHLFILRVKK